MAERGSRSRTAMDSRPGGPLQRLHLSSGPVFGPEEAREWCAFQYYANHHHEDVYSINNNTVDYIPIWESQQGGIFGRFYAPAQSDRYTSAEPLARPRPYGPCPTVLHATLTHLLCKVRRSAHHLSISAHTERYFLTVSLFSVMQRFPAQQFVRAACSVRQATKG